MFKLTAPLMIILITAIFLFLAATNIQGGWLYLVDALLWTILALALILPFLQLRQLRLKRVFPAIAYREQEIQIKICLTAPRFWPLMFINLSDLPPEDLRTGQSVEQEENSGFVLSLSGKSDFSYSYTFKPEKSGIYRFKKIRTGSFGPLGLLGIFHSQTLLSSLVVRPLQPDYSLNILSSEQEIALQSARQRSHHSEDISHFREYTPGDNRRSIHWKNTAKRQKLIVAEAREEPFQNALILVNTHQNQTDFQSLVTTAESVSDALLKQNLELTCWAQAGASQYWDELALASPQRFVQGARSWDDISYWLATLMPDSTENIYSALQQYSMNLEEQLLVVISEQLEPQLIQWLVQGRNQNNPMPVLLYTNQENLPPEVHTIAHVQKLLKTPAVTAQMP